MSLQLFLTSIFFATDQVLLYLERKTAKPMTIFIKLGANRNNLITEIVEETATIEDIMGIMQSLEVVAAWAETADTIVSTTSTMMFVRHQNL